MTGYLRQRAPRWFGVLAWLLILWAVIGVFALAQQVRLGADAYGPATAYDRALYASMPAWYNWVFATATVAALIGAALLLRRRAAARIWFLVSVVAVFVQFGYLFANTDIVAHKGAAQVLPFPLVILGIAAFQLWLAGHAVRRGWIYRG